MIQTELRKSILSVLEDFGKTYELSDDKTLIYASFDVPEKNRYIDMICDLQQEFYRVTAILPLICPGSSREAVLSLMNRINATIQFGHFYLTPDDGDICFTLSVDCINRHPSREIIERSLLAPCAACDFYERAFHTVCLGLATPEEAYDAAAY